MRMLVAGLAFLAAMRAPALAIDYSEEQERYCTGDAFRLCGSYIPDVERITACMIQLQDHLSPACKAVFIKEPAAKSSQRQRPRAPTQLSPERGR